MQRLGYQPQIRSAASIAGDVYSLSNRFATHVLLFLLWPVAIALAQPAENVFLDEPDQRAITLHSAGSFDKRSRLAKLNSSLFRGPNARSAWTFARLALNLFPDVQPVAVVVRTEASDLGGWLAHGYIEGQSGSSFTLSVEADAIAATVFIPRRGSYRILSDGEDRCSITELDPARGGACGVDGARGAPFGGGSSGTLIRKSLLPPLPILQIDLTPGSGPTTNQVSIVDVMVVYTGEARVGAGGTTAMNSLISLALAEANTVYQNSAANARFRLVYRGEVTNYTESSSLSTNLARLQIKDDMFLDEVHAVRDSVRADLVCLITEHSDPGVSGKAFIMSQPSGAFRSQAFSIVKRAEIVGAFVFAHELSHNLGCQHDRENALDSEGKIISGAFPYSFGHRFTANGSVYRDVMAYAPGQPIPYLSNPDVLFLGVATGLAGTTNGANNALTANNNAAIASAFYGPGVKTSPPIVRISAPQSPLISLSGTNLLLTAQATDIDGSVQEVSFYTENALLGSVPNSILNLTNLIFGLTNNFSMVWSNVAPGTYRIAARAVDNLGAASASTPVTVTVRPFNDDFINRITLTGLLPVITGTTRSGTAEPGEPMHAGNPGGQSVWYAWTAPRNGTVNLSVIGNGVLPLAEVYKSVAPNSQTLVSQVVEFDKTNSLMRAIFDATGGQAYSIAVDTLAGSSGEFTLSLAYQVAPPNDDFANRLAISGDSIQFTGTNIAATVQTGEPKHDGNVGGKSVWYAWTAPKSGPVIVTAGTTNFFPLLDVYRGTAVSTLTNVAQRTVAFDTTNRITTIAFDAVAGLDYAFAVDGFAGEVGPFQFRLIYPSQPANDAFANRQLLVGTLVSLDTSNLYATAEAGERPHALQPPARSIWFSWRAPVSGPVVVTSRGQGFFTLPDVYTGTNVATLIEVPRRGIAFDQTNLMSTLTFTAVAFESYALVIDGFSGGSGGIHLDLVCANVPPTVQLFSTVPTATNFKLRLFGSTGQSFVVQASTNLVEWSNIYTNMFATNSFAFTDDNSRNFRARFYRVFPLP